MGLNNDGEPLVESESHNNRDITVKVKESEKILQEIGQYKVDSILTQLYMGEGMNKQHGITTAACCDVMHTLKTGMVRYIMMNFFNMMTKTERAMFDYLYNSIFRANRQTLFSYSSTHGYPKTMFSAGISSVSNITANEWVGIMFVSAALCVTIRGQLIFADTMKKKWEKMVREWKN